jgi:hypothetical protein
LAQGDAERRVRAMKLLSLFLSLPFALGSATTWAQENPQPAPTAQGAPAPTGDSESVDLDPETKGEVRTAQVRESQPGTQEPSKTPKSGPVGSGPSEKPSETPSSTSTSRSPEPQPRTARLGEPRLIPIPKDAVSDRRESLGAMFTPAALPAGGMAVYGYVGVQDVGIGFRQGFGWLELEGRAHANYLRVLTGAEGLAKISVIHEEGLSIAPFVGTGIILNSGLQFFDTENFAYAAWRLIGGATLCYAIAEWISAIALFELPLDLGLGVNAWQFRPLAGAGVELMLGEEMTVSLLGQLGPDVFQAPNGQAATRLGYALKLGVGIRLF